MSDNTLDHIKSQATLIRQKQGEMNRLAKKYIPKREEYEIKTLSDNIDRFVELIPSTCNCTEYARELVFMAMEHELTNRIRRTIDEEFQRSDYDIATDVNNALSKIVWLSMSVFDANCNCAKE